MSNNLQHHGIKGQKWGVRRYQNKDGSLTSAGKKRYLSGDYESALRRVKKADDTLNDIRKTRQEPKKAAYEAEVRRKVSSMSDKELQQAVNRLNMEERYTQVMTQRGKLEKGKSKVDQILDVAGSTLTGAATALSIMVAITQLLEKKESK
jgi:DNA-nicking Smr family endonuclease